MIQTGQQKIAIIFDDKSLETIYLSVIKGPERKITPEIQKEYE
jgi:hypothetical protein